jgi:hypothetical protein
VELLSNVAQIAVSAGLLSAAAAYLLRVREQKQQERRELRGLLRLIAGEIARNVRTLKGYEKNPRVLIAASPETLLKSRNWDENRVRLAQLMESGERFGKIFTYYDVTARTEDAELWKRMGEDEQSKEYEKGLYGHVDLNRRAAKGAYGAIEKELEAAGFDSDEIRKLEKELPEPDASGNNDK